MEKPKNHTIAHSLVMALMIVLMGIFISNFVGATKNYYVKTHANFVKEYATIVRYEAMYAQNGRRTYSTFYEYEADGGVYYGLWQRLIENEEEAKAQVGRQAVIYVDHTLKIHVKDLNFAKSLIVLIVFSGIISIAACSAFLNSAIRETIYIVKWVKYKKSENKKQTDVK